MINNLHYNIEGYHDRFIIAYKTNEISLLNATPIHNYEFIIHFILLESRIQEPRSMHNKNNVIKSID